MNRVFATILMLITNSAGAEYRVFQIQITDSKTQNVRQVQSTLDPEQFQMVYPIGINEYVTYVQTWRCQGNTNHHKPYCQSPELNR
ncbi:MAG: hypothetical protein A2622_10155 [Bdellovibrionales bacterium RIFCSPHIGHO2_01_FULL_40_29]|nr:MAG: hypothetical protein A2622_10155 [Bdellovibrionales bacterium RIFCSPHIGHO2_01_FULL_40_29]OFZ32391.1 MAG: hypothetical protein A3D17_12505 [Bdellovibrionales bacterium RIFCSPHIGHO2_02_FULL_40_15]